MTWNSSYIPITVWPGPWDSTSRRQLCSEKRSAVPNASCTVGIDGAQQVILEKQQLDCFTNMNLQVLLDRLNADRYVVYGVVTEICVKFAAFGLLRTGKPVDLVTDAVRSLTEEAGSGTFRDFAAAGGGLTVAAKIIG